MTDHLVQPGVYHRSIYSPDAALNLRSKSVKQLQQSDLTDFGICLIIGAVSYG